MVDSEKSLRAFRWVVQHALALALAAFFTLALLYAATIVFISRRVTPRTEARGMILDAVNAAKQARQAHEARVESIMVYYLEGGGRVIVPIDSSGADHWRKK